MTDSRVNSGSQAERPQYEDDPLMELSRIMDFGAPAQGDRSLRDTRQPQSSHTDDFARGASVEPASGYDDFSLDLERELLGDYDQPARDPFADLVAEPRAEYRGRDAHPVEPFRDAAVDDFVLASPEDSFDLDIEQFQDELHAVDQQAHDALAAPQSHVPLSDPYQQAPDETYAAPPAAAYAPAASHAYAEQHGHADPYAGDLPAHDQHYFDDAGHDFSAAQAGERSLEDELANLLAGDDLDHGQQQESHHQPVDAWADLTASHEEASSAQREPSFDDFGADDFAAATTETFTYADQVAYADQPVAENHDYRHPEADLHAEDFLSVADAAIAPQGAEPAQADPAFDDYVAPASQAPFSQVFARQDDSLQTHNYGTPNLAYGRSNFSTDTVARIARPGEDDGHDIFAATASGNAGEDPFDLGDFDLSEPLDSDQQHQNQWAEPESSDDDLFALDDGDLLDAVEAQPAQQPVHQALHGDDLALSDEAIAIEDDFFAEDDFLSEEDLSADLDAQISEAPAYAHAVQNDDYSHYAPSFAQQPSRPAVYVPAPDVETLSVSENKVEHTHSLDLPEVNYGEEEIPTSLTDLDAEFAEVFSSVDVDDAPSGVDAKSEADKAFDDIFRENASSYASTLAVAAGAAAAAGRFVQPDGTARAQSANAGNQDDYYNHWANQGDAGAGQGHYSRPLAGQPEDELGGAAEAYRNNPVRGRRGMILASIAGAAVLLGGIGYHYLAGAGSGEPVVIHADTQPIKSQPENPGGVTVPNQDKAVYDRVAGNMPDNPEQKALISSGEDPVDISGVDDSADVPDENAMREVGGNESQPVQQASGPTPAHPLQPREVETMIVRPDGTMVPPAGSQPTAAAETPAPAASEAPANQPAPAATDEIGALAAGGTLPAAPASAPAAPAPAPAAPASQTAAKPSQANLPSRAPVVPSRPAEQPITIVGNVPQRNGAAAPANTQVAAAPAVAAGAGDYFVQIASQPSAELAQKSYASMSQKFGSVIGGRGVDIKKADIPGKGTYYRVRIQAGDKSAANALCQRLTAAGGSCLVTR